jgi:hypothetical protein
MPDGATWCLAPPPEAPVPFRGIEAAATQQGAPGSFLYPAATPAEFIAAVIAHAAIEQGVLAHQRGEHAASADKVLDAYRPMLRTFALADLYARAIERLATAGAGSSLCDGTRSDEAWIAASAPVYAMTQDQRALVLENRMSLKPPGTPDDRAYMHVVTVVSAPLAADDPVEGWTVDNGEPLKTLSAELLGQSLEVAQRLAAGVPVAADASYRTVRYHEGTAEKIVRAQLVAATCDRMLLKTLRDTFLSVPTMRADCDASAVPPSPGPAEPGLAADGSR